LCVLRRIYFKVVAKQLFNFYDELIKQLFPILYLLFSAITSMGQAEDGTPQKYLCYRAESPLKIDGIADEKSWINAEWTADFVDILGNQGVSPRFKTRTKMLWDNDYLYLYATLSEPHIWANLTKRDDVIFQDNDFEVFIDPDGDTHQYFEYEINALNTEWDLKLTKPYRDGGIAVSSFNFAGIKAAVSLQGTINNPADVDQSWSVEIAFPLKSFIDSSMALPLKSGDQWRINFSRVEWQTRVENGRYVKQKDPTTGKNLAEDNWVWSPQGRVDMHCPEKWGTVQFSQHVAGEDTTTFITHPEQTVKDELRKVYYAQRKFQALHKKYAQSLSELNTLESVTPEWKYVPNLIRTPQGYECTAIESTTGKICHINETGRVWSQK
jgi:Carbohydrate family 9 binding domain-like